MTNKIQSRPSRSFRTGLLALNVLCLAGLVRAETIVVESRTAADAANPAWSNVSGKWGKSKNKSKADDADFSATNVFSCTASSPVPAFKVSPPDIKAGKTYKLDVTFGTSKTQHASSDLVVAVSATGVTNSTIPATTPAFQEANANAWTLLGSFTAVTDKPTFTFTYASGTLSTNPPSRWYADALRFTSDGAAAKEEPKKTE
jgi:hypothetical protein